MLAVPHRSGTRAEHVCTEHHVTVVITNRDPIHIDPALRRSASLRTINTSTFNATGRPGRLRLARTINIYTRCLEHTGAPAYINFSSKGCACVCARRPVFPYGYLVYAFTRTNTCATRSNTGDFRSNKGRARSNQTTLPRVCFSKASTFRDVVDVTKSAALERAWAWARASYFRAASQRRRRGRIFWSTSVVAPVHIDGHGRNRHRHRRREQRARGWFDVRLPGVRGGVERLVVEFTSRIEMFAEWG